jgi:O-antigen/teichoic acid export membrane protein
MTAITPTSGARALRRDAAQFGWASALGAALGVVQVFLVPKLLDVTTFGLYRIFVLYAGYAGLLHFGGVDGALLRWASRSAAVVTREWRPAMRWLLESQTLVIAVAALAALGLRRSWPDAAVLVIALGVYALMFNTAALSAFALQTARRFNSAGLAVYGPNSLFLIALALVPASSRSIGVVLLLFVAAQAGTSIAVATRLARAPSSNDPIAHDLTRRHLVATGAPLMAANILGGLAQSIDRLILSWTVPVHEFALYGFAGSALFATNAAAQALGRVALPHTASSAPADRGRMLGGLYDLIICAFAVALAVYPLFEWIVTGVLPAYTEALPVVRAFLPGTFLWLGTQVVTNTALQAAGRVHIQLVLAGVAAVAIALMSGVAIAMHWPLWVVALGASTGTAVAWVAGIVSLERVAPQQRPIGSRRFLFAGLAITSSAVLVVLLHWNVILETAIYLIVAAAAAWPSFTRLRR